MSTACSWHSGCDRTHEPRQNQYRSLFLTKGVSGRAAATAVRVYELEYNGTPPFQRGQYAPHAESSQPIIGHLQQAVVVSCASLRLAGRFPRLP
jgi:hypothetical protein